MCLRVWVLTSGPRRSPAHFSGHFPSTKSPSLSPNIPPNSLPQYYPRHTSRTFPTYQIFSFLENSPRPFPKIIPTWTHFPSPTSVSWGLFWHFALSGPTIWNTLPPTLHVSTTTLEVRREYYQNCSVLGCVTQCSQSAAHSYEQFLQVEQIGFVTLGPLRHA